MAHHKNLRQPPKTKNTTPLPNSGTTASPCCHPEAAESRAPRAGLPTKAYLHFACSSTARMFIRHRRRPKPPGICILTKQTMYCPAPLLPRLHNDQPLQNPLHWRNQQPGATHLRTQARHKRRIRRPLQNRPPGTSERFGDIHAAIAPRKTNQRVAAFFKKIALIVSHEPRVERPK